MMNLVLFKFLNLRYTRKNIYEFLSKHYFNDLSCGTKNKNKNNTHTHQNLKNYNITAYKPVLKYIFSVISVTLQWSRGEKIFE